MRGKCPECGKITTVIYFDADNDQCTECKKWFPVQPLISEALYNKEDEIWELTKRRINYGNVQG